jgi:hypothetical protein
MRTMFAAVGQAIVGWSVLPTAPFSSVSTCGSGRGGGARPTTEYIPTGQGRPTEMPERIALDRRPLGVAERGAKLK